MEKETLGYEQSQHEKKFILQHMKGQTSETFCYSYFLQMYLNKPCLLKIILFTTEGIIIKTAIHYYLTCKEKFKKYY